MADHRPRDKHLMSARAQLAVGGGAPAGGAAQRRFALLSAVASHGLNGESSAGCTPAWPSQGQGPGVEVRSAPRDC